MHDLHLLSEHDAFCLGRTSICSAQLPFIWLKLPNAPAVWEWKGQALDEGDHAAMWLSEYLGKDVRLLRYAGMPSRIDGLYSSWHAWDAGTALRFFHMLWHHSRAKQLTMALGHGHQDPSLQALQLLIRNNGLHR